MVFFIFLLIIEILTITVFRDSIRRRSPDLYFVSILIHVIFSLWIYALLLEITTYKGFYDNPGHIRMLMSMTGTICAVIVPRVILIVVHYFGKLIRIRKGGYVRWMTNTALGTGLAIFMVVALSSLYGRFNFKTENVEIKISGLNKDLDGLRIVQISDLHLSSFYSHRKALQRAIDRVNSLKPDLILNTGDFISFGWREFDTNDSILRKAKSRYGNYAVMGNHDFGTYHPYFTDADRADNVLIVNNLIKASGYTVLNDTNTIIKIGNAKLALAGIITRGKFTNIIHGNLTKALSGLDSTDLTILMSHDPNQWEKDVARKTNVDITLSGHTHAMQMGIYTRWFRWSPAVRFYPHWNGLYQEGKQLHYVNRGLGTLSIPFRVWMPPEITLITLKRE